MSTINGTLYLSGGGNEHDSFPLDKFFFSEIPNKGNLLYIPVALRDHPLFEKAGEWMAGVIALHGRSDISVSLIESVSNDLALNAYDAVYIGGGNTWSLLKESKDAGLIEKLREFLEHGGHLYGGSAGAIILGNRIDTQDDANFLESKDISGADILLGYSIACHFTLGQRKEFRNWSQRNELPIICLTEQSGMIVKGREAMVVGADAHIFYPNASERLISVGEKILLEK